VIVIAIQQNGFGSTECTIQKSYDSKCYICSNEE